MFVMSGKVKVVNRVQFSADGTALAASGWGGFQVWDRIAPDAKPLRFPVTSGVDRFAFIGRSKQLYALGYYKLHRIDVETGACETLDKGRWIRQFAVSPDGRHLLLADYDGSRASYTLTRRETDAAHTLVWERLDTFWGLQMQYLPSGGSVLGHISPNYARRGGEWFAIRAADSGEEVHRSNPLTEYSNETVVSPDESLAACLTRFYIRIYPLRGQFAAPLRTIANDANRHFTGLAFHPSGRYLATTSNDATVRLYDTTTWELARTFTWELGRMRSICFSPDGTLAAAGADKGKVVVWDVDI